MSSKSVFVNALTFFRVPLIFAWLGLAIAQEHCDGFWFGFWAAVAMALSGLTDAFDGWLARKWGVVTTLGKMADPLMDKVFYVVAFPSLTWLILRQGGAGSETHATVMLFFAILYILRDLWVTFLRSVGTMYGADVAAMRLGKVRTALSFPCAVWVYLYVAFGPACGEGDTALAASWRASCYVFEGLMILITLVSLVTYTRSYCPYLKKALERN